MEKSIQLEEELFAAALALPALERRGYLQRACGEDQHLQARVDTLLKAFEAAAGFMEGPSGSSFFPEPQPRPEEHAGDQIGEYRLQQELGEGGCGVVYLAEQSAPVRRQVALKVIKLGMDTKAVIARFEAERQALALMDHPHIAQVFDAGATPAGRPYFVMELVRGIKITQYCDQSRLGLGERLKLFIQVCQAIQHAHHKGIIHRDIKPSNVLVTLLDGAPVAKVIDFGIAKATQGRLTERTLYTALEQFVGTPAYMSPEQTEPSGVQVDTRSDIYSLGVLLYELLTGYTPFETEALLQVGLEEMRQRIREEEPPTPSKRLSTLADEPLSTVAQRRQLPGHKLIKLVHRDLDWIVMRCLEKERTRRYQTANDLAADIQRYLNHEPTVARPPSALYALRKFTRRYRVVVLTASSLLAVLLIATAVSTWLAVRATRAEKRAQAEALTRQEVINFLQGDLLAQASPANEPDRDLKLRTVLDRAAEKIEGRFAEQPLVEATIRTTLAETYNSLGEYAVAQQHFERVLAIHEQQLGPENPRTLKVMNDLVSVIRDQGKLAAAEALATKALQLQRRVLGAEHPDTLDVMSLLASIQGDQGKSDQAQALQDQVLKLRQRVLGPEHPNTLQTMHELASAYAAQGKFAEAEQLNARTLELQKRVLGAEHPDTLGTMNNLAIMYSRQHKAPEALQLRMQIFDIAKRVLGPEHPHTLTAMDNLVVSHANDGNLAEAETLQTQALEAKRRVRGPDHPDTLRSMSNLAAIYLDQGKLAAAEALQIQAMDAHQRVLGPEHPNTLRSLRSLAFLYERAEKPLKAQQLLVRGLEISRRVLGPEHPDTLQSASNLGAVLLALRKPGEAESVLRSAMGGYEKVAPGDWQLFLVQSRLGEALMSQRRYAEAETLLISGYQGLRERAQAVPAWRKSEIDKASARIPKLYVTWNKPDKAQEWQRRLAETG